eukprot:scaffold5125_cov156-Amphora_coffeaeformis.AAC.2
MKSSVAATKQIQGTLLSRSLEDFLDSSESESGGSFACDGGSGDENDKTLEMNIEDTKKRPTLVGVIKRSMNPRGALKKQGSMRGLVTIQGRQTSMRSLFSKNGGGYQEELHSDDSDSSDDNDVAPKDTDDANQGCSETQPQNRRDLMKKSQPRHQGSRRSLFSGSSRHEKVLHGDNRDSGDDAGTTPRDTHDDKRANQSTNHNRQPNRRKALSSSRSNDSLGPRSCHESSRSKSDDKTLSSRSMHIPRRALATHNSDPGEIHGMTSANLIEQNKKPTKRSCSSTARPRRKQLHRSKSDPGEIDDMGCGSRHQSMAEKRRGGRQSDYTKNENLRNTDDYHGHCDQSLSSHGLLSDLSCSLHSVGEFECITEPDAPAYHVEVRSSVRVPISISIASDISKEFESHCTSLTDCDLSSEIDDEGIDTTLDKYSTRSKSSRKSFRRGNSHGSGYHERPTRQDSLRDSERHRPNDDHTDTGTAKSGVTLPGQLSTIRSVENGASKTRPFRRRLTNSYDETDGRLCTFNIDAGQPLVRRKHQGTSEFVELNISCHDAESVTSLVSINVRG